MRQDKNKAMTLRLKGYSYNEITNSLGVPKSTLSDWFTGLELPEKAQARIKNRVAEASLKGLIKKNKLQTHLAIQRAKSIRKEARKDIKKLSRIQLLLVGAALYWAEGYKKPIIKNGKERSYHSISLPNSDPSLIKIFVEFLKEICEIPASKINASIRIFEHINENEALRYWMKITGLPKENFTKFYYGISKSSQSKRPYNRLPYGMVQIRVNDTKKFHQIMGWIEGLGRHFQK